jgi:hypothetical protein
VDHEAVGELHGLGAGGAELAGDDDLAALGAALHDEAEDTVAGAADGEAVEELVAEGLALGDGGETAVLDLGGVEGDGVLGELEALLDEGGELADAATLLAEDLLGVGGADDDVGDGRGDADLDAGVALLSELALEEFVELGVEDTVSDELSPLGAVGRGMLARIVQKFRPVLNFLQDIFFSVGAMAEMVVGVLECVCSDKHSAGESLLTSEYRGEPWCMVFECRPVELAANLGWAGRTESWVGDYRDARCIGV